MLAPSFQLLWPQHAAAAVQCVGPERALSLHWHLPRCIHTCPLKCVCMCGNACVHLYIAASLKRVPSWHWHLPRCIHTCPLKCVCMCGNACVHLCIAVSLKRVPSWHWHLPRCIRRCPLKCACMCGNVRVHLCIAVSLKRVLTWHWHLSRCIRRYPLKQCEHVRQCVYMSVHCSLIKKGAEWAIYIFHGVFVDTP